jgi:hypothetical protein
VPFPKGLRLKPGQGCLLFIFLVIGPGIRLEFPYGHGTDFSSVFCKARKL